MAETKINLREPLEKLKTYPVFQHLRGKAELHQRKFRPKETSRLEKNGQLQQVLDERTQSCWNTLGDAMAQGHHQNEAEELAFPLILLPSEKEEEQALQDQREQMAEE